MLIRVVRSGGLAGSRIERAVDTATLPRGVGAALEAEVERLGLQSPAPRRVSGVPDAFFYRVSVHAGDGEHEATFDDTPRNADLREFAERVLGL